MWIHLVWALRLRHIPALRVTGRIRHIRRGFCREGVYRRLEMLVSVQGTRD